MQPETVSLEIEANKTDDALEHPDMTNPIKETKGSRKMIGIFVCAVVMLVVVIILLVALLDKGPKLANKFYSAKKLK